MKRIHVRIVLAIIFLALVQIACGCSVNKTVNIFVYQDTNGDGTQNQGEPAFPDVSLEWNKTESGTSLQGTTDSNGQASLSYNTGRQNGCVTNNFPSVPIAPGGERVNEYTGNTPWNCSPPALLSYMRNGVFDEEAQQRDLVIGLAPPFTDATAPQDVVVTCECNGTTQVCTDGTSTANAEACQPSAPATNAPVLSGPLLTGEVITLCDTVNRPVNLRLVAGADTALISSELTNGNLMVSIGGTDISSTCAINPSNTTLLTCTYPAGISSFPSPGVVTYNGTQIDSFNFDGENGCMPPSNGNTSNGDTVNPGPSATPSACDADPNSFACYCETNTDPDCP